MTWAISASATTLSVPIVSKSHCTNSRNRPLAGRSPRNTEPIAYRLKGTPRASICLATNRASGTVRSNRRASSPGVPPLLVTSKICRKTSSDPAPLPVSTSMRSMCGVSIGTKPKLENVWRNAASIRSRGIITAGGRSRSPLATRGSIMKIASLNGILRNHTRGGSFKKAVQGELKARQNARQLEAVGTRQNPHARGRFVNVNLLCDRIDDPDRPDSGSEVVIDPDKNFASKVCRADDLDGQIGDDLPGGRSGNRTVPRPSLMRDKREVRPALEVVGRIEQEEHFAENATMFLDSRRSLKPAKQFRREPGFKDSHGRLLHHLSIDKFVMAVGLDGGEVNRSGRELGRGRGADR